MNTKTELSSKTGTVIFRYVGLVSAAFLAGILLGHRDRLTHEPIEFAIGCLTIFVCLAGGYAVRRRQQRQSRDAHSAAEQRMATRLVRHIPRTMPRRMDRKHASPPSGASQGFLTVVAQQQGLSCYRHFPARGASVNSSANSSSN